MTVTLVWMQPSTGAVFQQTAVGQLEMETVSIHQPTLALLLSVPQFHLNWTDWPEAAGGRSTVVVINPLELPLHAARPASGLPKVVLMMVL